MIDKSSSINQQLQTLVWKFATAYIGEGYIITEDEDGIRILRPTFENQDDTPYEVIPDDEAKDICDAFMEIGANILYGMGLIEVEDATS